MKKKRVLAIGLGLVLVVAVAAICYVNMAKLSDDAAKSIALSHAGVPAESVKFIQATRDFDDGVLHYDVEFQYDAWEYDYEIHARTGEVISAEKDGPDGDEYYRKPTPTDPVKEADKDITSGADGQKQESSTDKPVTNENNEKPDDKPVVQENSGEGNVNQNVGSAKITKEEAENIALEHAGLAADQVRFDHTEYDGDDRYPEYEIEFYHDGWEYQYEVHAETGEILKSEKEWDD